MELVTFIILAWNGVLKSIGYTLLLCFKSYASQEKLAISTSLEGGEQSTQKVCTLAIDQIKLTLCTL